MGRDDRWGLYVRRTNLVIPRRAGRLRFQPRDGHRRRPPGRSLVRNGQGTGALSTCYQYPCPPRAPGSAWHSVVGNRGPSAGPSRGTGHLRVCGNRFPYPPGKATIPDRAFPRIGGPYRALRGTWMERRQRHQLRRLGGGGGPAHLWRAIYRPGPELLRTNPSRIGSRAPLARERLDYGPRRSRGLWAGSLGTRVPIHGPPAQERG